MVDELVANEAVHRRFCETPDDMMCMDVRPDVPCWTHDHFVRVHRARTRLFADSTFS
jgi:hypothetical protein